MNIYSKYTIILRVDNEYKYKKGNAMNELKQAFDILLNNKEPKSGYSKGGEKITLLDAAKPSNATINLGVGEYSVFTEEDGARLLAEAESLGLLKQRDFPDFPYIKKQEPKGIRWRVVYDNLSNTDLSKIKGTSLVTHGRESAECYYAAEKSSLVFKGLRGAVDDVVIGIHGDLKAHLSKGYNAYVDITGTTVLWTTVPNYFAMRAWRSALSNYHDEVSQWVEIRRMVVNAKEFHRAWQQDLLLSKLPFEWRVGVKPTPVAKPTENDALVKKEVVLTHLVFESNHYKDGVLTNKRNSFLCSPKMIDSPQWNKSAYEHELRIKDVLIKKIAHEITCPECLERLSNMQKTK